jgi:beta-galactosidase
MGRGTRIACSRMRAALIGVGVVAEVLCVTVVVAFWATSPAAAVGPSADSGTSPVASYRPSPVRRQIDLNTGWRFHKGDARAADRPAFDDSGWDAVDVPHTWNASDGQDGGDVPVVRTDYYRGPGWYRRHLSVPAEYAGKRMFLQFDGANSITDVWVNGVYLGQHKGGFARFRFDATPALNPGEDNVIAVKVSNAADPTVPPLSGDFTFFGGLYRDVSLQVTEPLHVAMLDYAGPGVYLRQRDVSSSSATVDVTTKIENASNSDREMRLRTIVTESGGRVVQELTSPAKVVAARSGTQITQTTTISSPRLWNGRSDPFMYRVSVELHDAAGRISDVVTQPLGARSFAVSASDGFSLNGRHLQLRGVNRHQDRRDKGWALSDSDHAEDFRMMAEMGVNALRTAHYQQDEQVYDLADELGFAVYTEIPLVNDASDDPEFRANAEQQLREMIRQNYNHPSVIFWGIGNELQLFEPPPPAADDESVNAVLEHLADVVDEEDPDRLSGYAHGGDTRSDTDPLTSHGEVVGYNKYYGWYHGTFDQFGSWADNLHEQDPDRRIGVTEYGAGASVHQHQEPLPTPPTAFGPWHPEEYQSLFHESYLKQIDARPWLWGAFVWNMFDFASDLRNEGDQPGINDKGLITHDRKVKKDAFYWYKANWTTSPVVYITSRRWTQRTSPATIVKVYSNADRVTLRVNGREVGTKAAGDHIFTWPVTLHRGVNTVTAVTTIGNETYSDTVDWYLLP